MGEHIRSDALVNTYEGEWQSCDFVRSIRGRSGASAEA